MYECKADFQFGPFVSGHPPARCVRTGLEAVLESSFKTSQWMMNPTEKLIKT